MSKRALNLPNWLPAAPAFGWWSVFFVAALASIVYASFGVKAPSSAVEAMLFDSLTLDNYEESVSSVYLKVFWITFRTAGLGTIACLLVGFPVAYALATRTPEKWRPWILFLLIFPYWVSFLLRTFAWRIILAPEGELSNTLLSMGVISSPLTILDTQLAVQLGIIYNYLPVAILPVFVALERINPQFTRAAADLGAGKVRAFFDITLPLALPGLIAGGVLTFVLAAGDYVVPAILGGARGLMIGRLIALQILEAQNLPLGSAMAVVLILLLLATGAGVALTLFVGRRIRLIIQGPSI